MGGTPHLGRNRCFLGQKQTKNIAVVPDNCSSSGKKYTSHVTNRLPFACLLQENQPDREKTAEP